MTSNPMTNNRVYENALYDTKPMTVTGAVNKTFLLLLIAVAVSLYTWNLCATGFSDKAMLLTAIGTSAGLVVAIIAAFKPRSSNILAPVYSICEGLVIGSVSYAYAELYDGIIINAATITFLVLFIMLGLYKGKVIQATPTFRKVVIISTFSIAIFYLIGLIGALLGHPMTIFNGGLMGIGLSLFICAIAALNFVLDFDFIERGVEGNAPQYLEWYGALSLMITIVWLYFEILRLLAQLNRRN